MTVHQLIAELDEGVDWVLVEGFKHSDLPKVEVWRAAVGKPARYGDDDFVVAIATDSPALLPHATHLPILDLNQPDRVAHWLLQHQDRFDYSYETLT
jgi:molybdopterin-guanine dinucleotide biosynthesis protein B